MINIEYKDIPVGKASDITGNRYGKLVVVSRVDTFKKYKKSSTWRCRCDCGGENIANVSHLKGGRTKTCGCIRKMVGEEHPAWKGGRHINNGYVMIKKPSHPRSNNNGYVFEHIVVMEEKIGRSLVGKENVHHINGQRKDNRPDNLELWSVAQPPGQRVKDKVDWCLEFLKLHAPEKLVL